MPVAPKVSVGLGTKVGYGLTLLAGGLAVAVSLGASVGIGTETLAILTAVSGLVTTAGRMVQSGWNTAPSVETEAGTVVPGGVPVTTPLPQPPTQPPPTYPAQSGK